MRKRKHNLCETSVVITALICMMAICLLPIKIVDATEIQLNETVTSLTETIDLNADVENKPYSIQNEAGVYTNTPAMETAEMTIINDEAVETVTDSKLVEIDQFKTEWVYPLTESELRLIALIAESEDRNAISAIAEVILNRIKSDKFKESTVTDIIYAKRQFHTANNITDDMIPSNEAIQAVETVFRDGMSIVGDATFFAEKSIPPQNIAKDLYLIDCIGQTAFYSQK